LELPVEKFSFNFKKTEIPEAHRKKLLRFICEKDAGNCSYNFPLYLLFSFYYLPFFSKAIAKNKQIKFIHVVKAYSLINSLFRFKNLSTDILKNRISAISIKLNRYIKKS